jgi:hypothetical protein
MKQIAFKGEMVTCEEIRREMREFDQAYPDTNLYDHWLEKANYKYAIFEGGKYYSPKHILSQATGISTRDFNSGGETNNVFRQCGFEAIHATRGRRNVRPPVPVR